MLTYKCLSNREDLSPRSYYLVRHYLGLYLPRIIILIFIFPSLWNAFFNYDRDNNHICMDGNYKNDVDVP